MKNLPLNVSTSCTLNISFVSLFHESRMCFKPFAITCVCHRYKCQTFRNFFRFELVSGEYFYTFNQKKTKLKTLERVTSMWFLGKIFYIEDFLFLLRSWNWKFFSLKLKKWECYLWEFLKIFYITVWKVFFDTLRKTLWKFLIL